MIDLPGRGRKPRIAYSIGLLAGGLATGSLFALISVLLPMPVLPKAALATLALAFALIAILRDLKMISLPLPENRRQVSQTVLRRSGSVGGLQFGFELGTGMRTYLPGSAPYLLITWILITGIPASSLLAGGLGFGLGRWLLLLDRDKSLPAAKWDRAILELRTPLSILGTILVGVALLYFSYSL